VSTVASVGAAALVIACWNAERPPDTVVYASGTDLESGNPLVTIHPLSRQIQRFVLYVTLAKYDDKLQPTPYAATSWSWSPDRRDLTLHLANGLQWQDGVPTTAHDVAYTLEAARDPATGYLRSADLAGVDTVLARDDQTVEIRFHAPQSSLPLVFCELPIVPAHLLDTIAHAELRRAAFNFAPVGNGPFEFVERRAGSRWTFRRNPRFPSSLGGPPRVAGLVVAVVDEPTTKFAGLASGELDVAGISPAMAPLARRDPSMRVVEYPILFTTGLVFNVRKPPFDDARVRRAISFSIDRARIVAAALAGFGVPATGPVPPESPLALPATASRDTTRADSLLDAAGWKRSANGIRQRLGRPLELDLLTVGSGDNALEQLVQADLAVRGIRVSIRQVELGTFLNDARAATKTFDVLVAGIPGDVALSFVSAMFETRQRGGALDYTGFHSRELDSLFVAARNATDEPARVASWRSAQQVLDDSMPVAWLYYSRGVQGVSARLRHVTMDLRGEMVSVSDWSIESAAARKVAASR